MTGDKIQRPRIQLANNWQERIKNFNWGSREWAALIGIILAGSVLLLASGFGSGGGQPVLPPFPTRTPLPTFTATPAVTPPPTEIPATPTPTPAAVRIHVVQPGDNLFRIATRYGTTVQAIKDANNLTNNTIFTGQELIIP